MYETVDKKDPLNAAFGKLYKDEIPLVGGSREETESLQIRVAFPQFNPVSPVAYAMEQDALGRPPNSDASVMGMFGKAPAANL
jgi:hypothetical protein